MKQFGIKKSITLIITSMVLLFAGCITDNNQSSTIQKDVSSENHWTETGNSSVAIAASESISNIESKLPFYKKVTVYGRQANLITYLGAVVSSNKGTLTINYDEESKKPNSISIELDALGKDFAERALKNLQENRTAASSIHNEKIVEHDNEIYTVVGDVDLEASFEQLITTWLIEQQDIPGLIQAYKETFVNHDSLGAIEEGDNYFYHPTMELRVEWE